MGTIRSLLASAAAIAATFVSAQALAFPPKIEVQSASPTGSLPKGVTISPDGKHLYVTNYGATDRNNVSIFDAATMKLVRSIDVPGTVVESALAPDGKTIYLSNFKRNSVQFVDIESGKVTREIKAGMHPKILVVSHDGKSLFAANWGNESVTQIDTKTGDVVRTLRTEKNPRGMTVTKGGKLYVANFNSRSIDVFEGQDLSKHHRLKDVCIFPRHLALSPDESKLYVSCLLANEVAVMDTKEETFSQRVKVGRFPKALDVTPDGRYVVTADYRGSSTTIIDTTDWSTRTLDIPSMDAASGIVIARGNVWPAKAMEVEAKADSPHQGEPSNLSKPKAKDAKIHAKPSKKPDEKPEKKKGAPPLRFFVTGWYDNHLYAVGVAGTGPKYEVDKETALLTQKHRRFHLKHPVE